MKILIYIKSLIVKLPIFHKKVETWIDILDSQIDDEGKKYQFDVDVDEDGPFIIWEPGHIEDR